MNEPVDSTHALVAQFGKDRFDDRRGVPVALVPPLDRHDHQVAMTVDDTTVLTNEEMVGNDTNEFTVILGHEDDTTLLGCGPIVEPSGRRRA